MSRTRCATQLWLLLDIAWEQSCNKEDKAETFPQPRTRPPACGGPRRSIAREGRLSRSPCSDRQPVPARAVHRFEDWESPARSARPHPKTSGRAPHKIEHGKPLPRKYGTVCFIQHSSSIAFDIKNRNIIAEHLPCRRRLGRPKTRSEDLS